MPIADSPLYASILPLYPAPMNGLPEATPESLDFASRLGKTMAPLIRDGKDLREAERAAALVVAAALRAEGAAPDVVDKLLEEALERSNIGAQFRHDERPVSARLQETLEDSYRAAGDSRLSTEGLLVEKRVDDVETGYPMFVFPNESKHPGNPHVTVIVGQERVNITIAENPMVIAGNKNAIGIGQALRAVKEHRVRLRQEWDTTRPDDQKLENSKARKAKAPRDPAS